MNDWLAKFSGFAIHNNSLMYQIITEAGFSPAKEPHYPIWPPATVFHIPSTVIRPPRHGIGVKADRHLNNAFDLSLQIIRDSFICIDGEYPVFGGIFQGAIFLGPESWPVRFIHLVRIFAANCNRLIGAAGIQDDDFVCPGNRCKTFTDGGFFVFNNNDNR